MISTKLGLPSTEDRSSVETSTSPIRTRLELVRETLRRHGVAAVIVPSSDPHLSEYQPQRWQARQWLSGFTGSVGTLVVTNDRAALFADGRYWVQAEAQLEGSGIDLVKVLVGSTTDHIGWLVRTVLPGQSVAVDGQVLSLAAAQLMQGQLQAADIRLRSDVDLVGEAWAGERPALPMDSVYEHREPFATVKRPEKLAALRDAMCRHGASHHLVSTVDDIAWITNLRGSDVSYNPVFMAHLLADMDGATLFIADAKIGSSLREALAADGISLAPYESAGVQLARLPASAKVLLDPKRVTLGLRQQLPASARTIEAINPSTLLKSRKTGAELAHVREAMAEDGAAMCEFYAWFEAALARGERITEIAVHERLTEARSRRPGFVGPSFNTVAGLNAHGAMPHYQATPQSNAIIEGDGLLLIDSGAQYLGGTTDVTRVWPIGAVSAAMKRDYTLVLKGTMALSRTRFPRGTLSPMLDAIARAPLWEQGLDFGHGTGHGVGYFLNVHEGPQLIARVLPDASMAMELGMITSIEPGVYREGHWGVRIENLALAVPAHTPEGNRFAEMLEFETLTLCPIDTRCLDASLLRQDETDWLNGYHAMVRDRVAPRVVGAAADWLMTRTAAVS